MDFLAKFSRLVNGMGQNLVLSWTKLVKSGNVKEAGETLQAVEVKVPLLLQLLVHEDDDISTNVVGFCYEYLHVLKQVGEGLHRRSRWFLNIWTLTRCWLFLQLPELTEQQKSNMEVSL